MSFQKFKKDGYCVGVKHRFATTKIVGNIASKGNEVIIGHCSICI